MARRALASFAQRFDWTLDDLRALTGTRPILAEGWGLRPDLIAPFLDSPRRMVVLVATAEFRDRQQRALPRARKLHYRVSDPECGQRNRLARDRLLAEDAAARAEEHGILTITVDGSLNAQQIADLVAHQFRPFLTVEPSTDLFS